MMTTMSDALFCNNLHLHTPNSFRLPILNVAADGVNYTADGLNGVNYTADGINYAVPIDTKKQITDVIKHVHRKDIDKIFRNAKPAKLKYNLKFYLDKNNRITKWIDNTLVVLHECNVVYVHK